MCSVINVLLNLTFQVYNVQYTNYQCYDIDMLLYLHFQVYNYSTTQIKISILLLDMLLYSTSPFGSIYVHKLLIFCQ